MGKNLFSGFMVLLLSVLMLGLGLSADVLGESKENSKAEKHYEKGRKAYLLLSPEGFEDAVKHYKEAIEADPDFAPAYAGLGEVYSFIGYFKREDREDYEDAYNRSHENIVRALQLDEDSLESQRALALSYLHLQRKKDAQTAAERALALNPNDAESHYILWAAGERDPKSPIIKKALELDPSLIVAHVDLGSTYFFQKSDYEKAAEHYKHAVEINEDSARTHTYLGNALRFLAYRNKALEHYKKAIKIDPDFVPAYVNYGVGLYYMGELEESIAQEKKALSLNPNYPEAYYFLGRFYEATGNTKEAIANYQKFVDLVSKHDRYASYLTNARGKLAGLNGTN
ncbi:MAG TPA: tetratricopeptide repeat protein [Thermodesulfobacteriota bacterium]|nr:tetratricopeptide repeat protein [Thermodesulfobacteriota bacterium]